MAALLGGLAGRRSLGRVQLRLAAAQGHQVASEQLAQLERYDSAGAPADPTPPPSNPPSTELPSFLLRKDRATDQEESVAFEV